MWWEVFFPWCLAICKSTKVAEKLFIVHSVLGMIIVSVNIKYSDSPVDSCVVLYSFPSPCQASHHSSLYHPSEILKENAMQWEILIVLERPERERYPNMESYSRGTETSSLPSPSSLLFLMSDSSCRGVSSCLGISFWGYLKGGCFWRQSVKKCCNLLSHARVLYLLFAWSLRISSSNSQSLIA